MPYLRTISLFCRQKSPVSSSKNIPCIYRVRQLPICSKFNLVNSGCYVFFRIKSWFGGAKGFSCFCFSFLFWLLALWFSVLFASCFGPRVELRVLLSLGFV